MCDTSDTVFYRWSTSNMKLFLGNLCYNLRFFFNVNNRYGFILKCMFIFINRCELFFQLRHPIYSFPFVLALQSTDNLVYIIYVFFSILGYYSDEWVDEYILVFLSTLSSEEWPSINFEYGHFLSNEIHKKFL